jgi:hypothetical protein
VRERPVTSPIPHPRRCMPTPPLPPSRPPAALAALEEVPNTHKSWADLWYRCSPLLICHLPHKVTEAWERAIKGVGAGGDDGAGGGVDGAGARLDPVKLIPAMVRYEQVRASRMTLPGAVAEVVAAATLTPGEVLGRPAIGDVDGGGDGSFDAVLGFLEWVASPHGLNCGETAIHNLLLNLYAQQPVEELLLRYVSNETAAMDERAIISGHAAHSGGHLALGLGGDDAGGDIDALLGADDDDAPPAGPRFDLHYALRVCLAAGRLRTCVSLYTAMGAFAEAVELALRMAEESGLGIGAPTAAAGAGGGGGGASGGHKRTASGAGAAEVDMDGDEGDAAGDDGSNPGLVLAKDVARSCPVEEKELRKRLWTRIAEWVIAHDGTAKDAVAVIHESEAALRVEDVLPYFPGITIIDDFKEELNRSLQEANADIVTLRQDMAQYQESAEKIRSDIRGLRNRSAYVRVGQKCDLCGRVLMATDFYLFPCAHAFHRDCLLGETSKHVTDATRRRLETLTTHFAHVSAALEAIDRSRATAGERSAPPEGAVKAAGQLLVKGGGAGVAALAAGSSATYGDMAAALHRRRAGLQADLDKHIASECLFCGEAMINAVADPLDLLSVGGGGGGGMADDWRL